MMVNWSNVLAVETERNGWLGKQFTVMCNETWFLRKHEKECMIVTDYALIPDLAIWVDINIIHGN